MPSGIMHISPKWLKRTNWEWGMPFRNVCRLSACLSVLLLLAGASSVLADQVAMSYVDAESNAQSMTLDCNSSSEDLALAASLMGENGVGLALTSVSSCSVADIGAAMATASPVHAAGVAQALATLSPDNAEAIAATINAVSGVNTNAVLAAVHFGPTGTNVGPQSVGSDSAISLDLNQTESVPSRN